MLAANKSSLTLRIKNNQTIDRFAEKKQSNLSHSSTKSAKNAVIAHNAAGGAQRTLSVLKSSLVLSNLGQANKNVVVGNKLLESFGEKASKLNLFNLNSPFQLQQRRGFFSFVKSKPKSPEQLVTMINKNLADNKPQKARELFESNTKYVSPEAIKSYLIAMDKLGQLNRITPQFFNTFPDARLLVSQMTLANPAASMSSATSSSAVPPNANANTNTTNNTSSIPPEPLIMLNTATGASSSIPLGNTFFHQQQKQQQQQGLGGSSSEPLAVRIHTTTSDRIWSIAGSAFFILFLVFAWYIFGQSESEKKSLNMPISNAHTEATQVKERFDDVKGIDEVRGELEQIVDYLKNPQKYTRLGAKLPRGILLTGEPGTGKTLLARAIAGEAGVTFLYCSGSAFDELFVGVGPKRVRALFEDARAVAPCIIFIDEIDAMGMARRYSFGSSHAKESTLNQLLTEMDGFKQNDGIIVIGATNIPEALDSALTRPGRFDKQIAVPMPDLKARKEILNLYMKKITKADDVNLEKLAKRTPRFSGANLANLVNQAAIKAAIKNLPAVDMSTFDEALDEILMGVRHKNLTMLNKEIKRTAFHEAGHTLCQLFTEGAMPLYKVTIIPRGRALGVTIGMPETDEVSHSKQELFAHMVVAMGGKVAEEIIFGENDVSGGCRSDLKQATNLAKTMITQYGMSERLGNVFYNIGTSNNESTISDSTQKLIDDEIIRLSQLAYETAKKTLKEKNKELQLLAEALLENETLEADEVRKIIQGVKILPSNGKDNNNGGNSKSSAEKEKKREEEEKKTIPVASMKNI